MTKVILYSAISADGFIAGAHGETPWSDEEWAAYREFVKSCDVCLLGRRTYTVMHDGGEFVDGAKYLVVTDHPEAYGGEYEAIAIHSAVGLPKAEKIGIIGGGELNGSIAALGVVDEIILDVESVLLGEGTRLSGSHNVQMDLELLSSNQIGSSTIQNHYKVMK